MRYKGIDTGSSCILQDFTSFVQRPTGLNKIIYNNNMLIGGITVLYRYCSNISLPSSLSTDNNFHITHILKHSRKSFRGTIIWKCNTINT